MRQEKARQHNISRCAKSLSHHMMCDTRCGHATAQKTVGIVRWVWPESRGQLQALEKLEIIALRRPRRGRRGTNRELQGRSCEKPRARGPARGYSRCGRRRRRFGTLSLRRPPRGLPAAGAPQTPYRLQPLFCVNISHYLKYVRSKFPGSSYSGRKATVISHFGCRGRKRGIENENNY